MKKVLDIRCNKKTLRRILKVYRLDNSMSEYCSHLTDLPENKKRAGPDQKYFHCSITGKNCLAKDWVEVIKMEKQ
jgi:hypothetical protein